LGAFHVPLRDRFLVVGVSAIKDSPMDFSALRICDHLWRFSLLLVRSAAPVEMRAYEGFKEYFFSRRKWFFGAMAVLFIVDLYDSYMKGPKYFDALGHIYKSQIGFYVVCSLVAIKVKNERFHAAFCRVHSLV
jgi:hypothetical protein